MVQQVVGYEGRRPEQSCAFTEINTNCSDSNVNFGVDHIGVQTDLPRSRFPGFWGQKNTQIWWWQMFVALMGNTVETYWLLVSPLLSHIWLKWLCTGALMTTVFFVLFFFFCTYDNLELFVITLTENKLPKLRALLNDFFMLNIVTIRSKLSQWLICDLIRLTEKELHRKTHPAMNMLRSVH